MFSIRNLILIHITITHPSCLLRETVTVHSESEKSGQRGHCECIELYSTLWMSEYMNYK